MAPPQFETAIAGSIFSSGSCCSPLQAAPVPPLTVEETSLPKNVPGKNIKLTWEPKVAAMIRERVESAARMPLMVALVGIPGSGKSTSADILSSLLSAPSVSTNATQAKLEGISNVVVPMDGYHYALEALRKFPDPDDVIYRRGAPDTFDAGGLKNDLRRISMGIGNEPVVKIPGFDHAKGDPEPDAHTFIRDGHSVVICEGLYLLHNKDGWETIADEFDFKIFVESDVDVCVDRLKVRNKCIPGYTAEEIDIRCDAVDRVNAHTVLRSRDRADVVVKSAA